MFCNDAGWICGVLCMTGAEKFNTSENEFEVFSFLRYNFISYLAYLILELFLQLNKDCVVVEGQCVCVLQGLGEGD